MSGAPLITERVRDQAARRGAHVFIRHDGRAVTYAEFDRLSNRAAHALQGLGVRRGDRVTLGVGNSVEYLVAALGALKAGAILHPINHTAPRARPSRGRCSTRCSTAAPISARRCATRATSCWRSPS